MKIHLFRLTQNPCPSDKSYKKRGFFQVSLNGSFHAMIWYIRELRGHIKVPESIFFNFGCVRDFLNPTNDNKSWRKNKILTNCNNFRIQSCVKEWISTAVLSYLMRIYFIFLNHFTFRDYHRRCSILPDDAGFDRTLKWYSFQIIITLFERVERRQE